MWALYWDDFKGYCPDSASVIWPGDLLRDYSTNTAETGDRRFMFFQCPSEALTGSYSYTANYWVYPIVSRGSKDGYLNGVLNVFSLNHPDKHLITIGTENGKATISDYRNNPGRFRHNGGVNEHYLDGHVEGHTQQEWANMAKDGVNYNRYWKFYQN